MTLIYALSNQVYIEECWEIKMNPNLINMGVCIFYVFSPYNSKGRLLFHVNLRVISVIYLFVIFITILLMKWDSTWKLMADKGDLLIKY